MCTVDERMRWIFIFNKVCTDNVYRFMPSWPQPQVFQVYSISSCGVQGNIQAFRLTGLLWWQKLLWLLQQFFFYFLQFNSAFSVSFHNFHKKLFESSLTVAWFSWTNHNSLLGIATNEIASFYIDNRLHQMAILAFANVGKGRLSSNNLIF